MPRTICGLALTKSTTNQAGAPSSELARCSVIHGDGGEEGAKEEGSRPGISSSAAAAAAIALFYVIQLREKSAYAK